MAEELAKNDDGDTRPLYLLGLLTNHGFGTGADPLPASEIQTRAAAAGNADALFELFLFYETGLAVYKSSETALHYLQQASDKGHGRAMYILAALLATGRGIEKDLVKAAEWYRRSSDAGNARATANLGMMYAKGEGVKKSMEQAKLFFDEAEYMGLDVNDARASVGL